MAKQYSSPETDPTYETNHQDTSHQNMREIVMKKLYWRGILFIIITSVILCGSAQARQEISLNGEWEMQYSREGDRPLEGEWTAVAVPSILHV